MPTVYYVPRSAIARIDRAAKKADIHEICYLFFGRGSRVHRVLRIPNRASDTVMNCVMFGQDVKKARSRKSVKGLNLLAYFHTHILSRAVPSKTDVRGWKTGTLLFIYSEIYGELRAFRLQHGSPGYSERRVVVLGSKGVKRKGVREKRKLGGVALSEEVKL